MIPLGHVVRLGFSERFGFEPDARHEIIGVVGDDVYTTPREGMQPAMYVAMAARDPLTLAGAAGVLVAVGLLAAWLPARRATRVDPVEVLRSV